MLALPQKGTCTTIQETLSGNRWYDKRNAADFNGLKESYQTMMFGESTIKVKSTWPDLLDIIKEAEKIHSGKSPKSNPVPAYPRQLSFVESHRTGSHREHREWEGYGGIKHTANLIVEDFETVYLDCLPGKEWLEAHKDFEMPEPLIEITVDGGNSKLSLNGNYKHGMIGDFMGEYCYPGEGKLIFLKDGRVKVSKTKTQEAHILTGWNGE